LALVRHQDEIYESVEGVHFLMRTSDKQENVACVITREALADRGASHHPPLNTKQVFDTYLDEIERAANDRWERGEVDKRSLIYVTTEQFPRRPPVADG
jgi:hypothetical protein